MKYECPDDRDSSGLAVVLTEIRQEQQRLLETLVGEVAILVAMHQPEKVIAESLNSLTA